MSSQFPQDNAVGNSVKHFIEVQVDNIHSFPLIQLAGHLDTGRDQLGQAGPPFHELMLAEPGPLVVLPVLPDGIRMICSMTFHSTRVGLTGF